MRITFTLLLLTCLLTSACTNPLSLLKSRETATVQTPDATEKRPKTRPDSLPEPPTVLTASGITVTDAARVSKAEVAAATKPIIRPEQDRGTTIASLGLLNRDGFWLATPLVKSETKGRIVVVETGASVNVMLVPNGGAPGAGSQVSIAALKILGVSPAALVNLRVFVR